MPVPLVDDLTFAEEFEQLGPHAMSERRGIGLRAVFSRRRVVERHLGRRLTAPNRTGGGGTILPHPEVDYPGRIETTLKNGVMLCGSDAHYWPGIVTTAHKAFVKFCKDLKPQIVILNGDGLDGATISRFPRIGWDKRPSLIQELEAVQERLGELEQAAARAKRYWCLGNHDARFETRLANQAPEYAHINGMCLKDHFPAWEPCWSVWVNSDVVVKHRWKGGIHATHNNTLNAGKTIITGHLHSAKVTPFTDYTGTRYGVDLGMLADPFGPQFEYIEDNPRNWRGAFGVFTFENGFLHPPELCYVIGKGKVSFRGKTIHV